MNTTQLAYWKTLSLSENKKLARWAAWQCPCLVPGTGNHIPSPVQQWRGNINYRFVRINTVCRREGEEENREAYLEWGCACPVLANYILTKHFKGSYENQSKPGCQWTPSNTVVTDAISLCFYWLTSSDLLLSSSSFFEVVSTVAALVVSTDFLKKRFPLHPLNRITVSVHDWLKILLKYVLLLSLAFLFQLGTIFLSRQSTSNRINLCLTFRKTHSKWGKINLQPLPPLMACWSSINQPR